MTEAYAYEGSELGLFAAARNWKGYIRAQIRPYIRGNVLEVGAGNGNTTMVLLDCSHLHWTCVEPDRLLAETLARSLRATAAGRAAEVIVGTIVDLAEERLFDTILYVDVLEHIEDDAEELRRVAGHLCEGGRLVILAPAHQVLFSEFDAAIGHFRRYDRSSLSAVIPVGFQCERLRFLDSAGLFLSAGNRLLLRRSVPTLAQVQTWDRLFVPVSRLSDPMLGYRVGKSVLGVWRKVKH